MFGSSFIVVIAILYLLDFCLDIIFHNLYYFASEIQKVLVPLFVSAITYQAIMYNGIACLVNNHFQDVIQEVVDYEVA